jgi:predicted SprT family Zn-dependent metalloprotease
MEQYLFSGPKMLPSSGLLQTGSSSNQSKVISYDTKQRILGTHAPATVRLFGTLLNAYTFFDSNLFMPVFGEKLPEVVLTLNKHAYSKGYYKPAAWIDEFSQTLPEINISPSTLFLPPIDALSTLVHEMAHHYHFHFGKKVPRMGYHNAEFSSIMYCLGLQCSETGLPGGKETGQHMTHYIIRDGLYEKTYKDLPLNCIIAFRPIEEYEFVKNPKATVQHSRIQAMAKNKTKYTCLGCSLAMWGKPNAYVKCGNCDMQLVVIDDFGKQPTKPT